MKMANAQILSKKKILMSFVFIFTFKSMCKRLSTISLFFFFCFSSFHSLDCLFFIMVFYHIIWNLYSVHVFLVDVWLETMLPQKMLTAKNRMLCSIKTNESELFSLICACVCVCVGMCSSACVYNKQFTISHIHVSIISSVYISIPAISSYLLFSIFN